MLEAVADYIADFGQQFSQTTPPSPLTPSRMEPNPCASDFAPRTSPYAMPARALFQKVASLGFESVQLAFSSVEECSFAVTDHIEIPEAVSPAAIEAILEASGETGVAIGAVNGTWNMAHPDSEVRAEGLRRMEGFLAAAKALGCPIATLCSGTRSLEHLWHASNRNGTDEAWNDMLTSMRSSALWISALCSTVFAGQALQAT